MDFNLERFVKTQHSRYETVLSELKNGQKKTHWMWFVFPQIEGLGKSQAAQYYAIRGLEEALAYLSHPVLGERLRECVGVLLKIQGRTLHEIFGHPDDWKFRSSMTLFEYVSPDEPYFAKALERYCDGKRDDKTLEIIQMRQTESATPSD